MSRRGDTYTNPVTGERAVVRNGDEDDPTKPLLTDLYVRPGGAVAGEHVHEALTETFIVISGRIGYSLDGVRAEAGPGGRIAVPPGTRHDWWNAGDEEAHVLVEIDGPVAARFEELIVLLFGLAHEGKVNAKGMPDPLQLAVVGAAYSDVIRFTSPPLPVQRLLFAVLAPLGRLFGKRASYPQHRDLVVERAAGEPYASSSFSNALR